MMLKTPLFINIAYKFYFVALYAYILEGCYMSELKPKDYIEILGKWDISIDDLWSTALELYVPAPNWNLEKAKELFMKFLDSLRNDVNINSLVLAASKLEEAGYKGLIPKLSIEEFKSDPVHLLADEIIGLAIANYISGTKGVFEYIRYDRIKPGVIKKLGPFMDDVVASIVGGVMSRVYSELLGGI